MDVSNSATGVVYNGFRCIFSWRWWRCASANYSSGNDMGSGGGGAGGGMGGIQSSYPNVAFWRWH